jgi:hypothetical protein
VKTTYTIAASVILTLSLASCIVQAPSTNSTATPDASSDASEIVPVDSTATAVSSLPYFDVLQLSGKPAGADNVTVIDLSAFAELPASALTPTGFVFPNRPDETTGDLNATCTQYEIPFAHLTDGRAIAELTNATWCIQDSVPAKSPSRIGVLDSEGFTPFDDTEKIVKDKFSRQILYAVVEEGDRVYWLETQGNGAYYDDWYLFSAALSDGKTELLASYADVSGPGIFPPIDWSGDLRLHDGRLYFHTNAPNDELRTLIEDGAITGDTGIEYDEDRWDSVLVSVPLAGGEVKIEARSEWLVGFHGHTFVTAKTTGSGDTETYEIHSADLDVPIAQALLVSPEDNGLENYPGPVVADGIYTAFGYSQTLIVDRGPDQSALAFDATNVLDRPGVPEDTDPDFPRRVLVDDIAVDGDTVAWTIGFNGMSGVDEMYFIYDLASETGYYLPISAQPYIGLDNDPGYVWLGEGERIGHKVTLP